MVLNIQWKQVGTFPHLIYVAQNLDGKTALASYNNVYTKRIFLFFMCVYVIVDEFNLAMKYFYQIDVNHFNMRL